MLTRWLGIYLYGYPNNFEQRLGISLGIALFSYATAGRGVHLLASWLAWRCRKRTKKANTIVERGATVSVGKS